VIQAFKGTQYQVVISTGGGVLISELAPIPSNIQVFSWVPGPAMLDRAHLAIFHGGYTRMDILKRGLPSIVIPFHSEQECYGRRMEALGATVVLPFSSRPWEKRNIKWAGREFTFLYRSKPDLTAMIILKTVQKMFEDQSYRKAAEETASLLQGEPGGTRARILIEEYYHRQKEVPRPIPRQQSWWRQLKDRWL
jgi:UDP:flavonoid glycosyltransferase YjiC (YdhE family)